MLVKKPAKIDNEFLRHYQSFTEFLDRTSAEPDGGDIAPDTATPEEALEDSYLKLRAALADDLLERLKACSPSFCRELLRDLQEDAVSLSGAELPTSEFA